MIVFKDISNELPYKKFLNLYKKAEEINEPCLDVICLSTFDFLKNEANARFLNLKYIYNDNWIFFSNYNSVKANEIAQNNKVSMTMYWKSLEVQIRLKGKILKSSEKISDSHYESREELKNALSVSSNQSSKVDSYEYVLRNYNEVLDKKKFTKRPKYWGGYTFVPYYFEFWEGHKSRINKREAYELKKQSWISYFLEP